jgi:hypothetical protein
MSSSKVSPTTTEQTSTEQTPSILNNNYVKIGGAIFVFFIFVIILYRSFSSSQSSQSQRRVNRFACILYPACDFLDSISDVNKDLIIKEYPDIDVNMLLNHKSISIFNHDRQEFNNVYIQSIRSEGYNITGYSGPNFFGEKYLYIDGKNGNIEIKCLKPIRSIKIEKDPYAFTN